MELKTTSIQLDENLINNAPKNHLIWGIGLMALQFTKQ